MFSSLRQRLILNHVLPLLLIIPLMGIALIYVLETEVLLPDLARELTGQARLVARLAKTQPDIWTNPAAAQAFAAEVSNQVTARVMLLDAQGHLLASTDASDADRLGEIVDLSSSAGVLVGNVIVQTAYSRQLHAEIADVWYPVLGANQQAIGVVRLTHRLLSVQEQFLRQRYLIAGVLIAGLVLGTGVGLLLALNMESPLRQVTQAIFGLAGGRRTTLLNEQGPEEIRHLLRAVNTLVERLQSLEQARRQLLANLVHELGRPLGALRSAVQALASGADKDVTLRQELLIGMEGEMERLQRLLDDLAQLHEQVLGTLELNRQPITLSEWLPHVLVPWREAARSKNLQWEVTIPSLPPLEADPDRLAQVVGNLLSNAIKYTPERGTVQVSAGQENGKVWIRISDTGPGIAAEEQAQIFSPLYRGRATARFPQGMGLGLTIARDLAIAHGGCIEVASEPGQGSHFTVWLPQL